MQTKPILLLFFLIIGAFSSYIGIQGLFWLGSKWLNTNSSWGLNTYIRIPAQTSLILGIISLWLGGIFAGVTVILFLTSKYYINSKFFTLVLIPFFTSIILTGLGFNTLDWMISPTSGAYPLWTLHLPFTLEAWNWYMLFGVIPDFVGGLFIGLVFMFAVLTTMKAIE